MDTTNGDSAPEQDYQLLLEIERLESLLEEIEESGDALPIPVNLQSELNELRLRSTAQLRERIASLHAQIVDE